MLDASGIPDHVRADIQNIRDVIAGKMTIYQTGPPLHGSIDDIVRVQAVMCTGLLLSLISLPPTRWRNMLLVLIIQRRLLIR